MAINVLYITESLDSINLLLFLMDSPGETYSTLFSFNLVKRLTF